jgi:superfamily I DNA/RNA helicase
MTWLHPRQARLVAQRWSGPARVRGAAGTGKTVVALHRAKHLAAGGKRVLFTSFVRNLPTVQQQLFARLAPGVPGRVEFVNIHAWARRLLASRGVRLELDDDGVESCFNLAWVHVGRGSALAELGSREYWQEEVQDVIKSRGLTSYDDYAALRRVGRRLPLQSSQRELVWDLYQEYERLRIERGIHDWADVLTLALESVNADPVEPAYDAVIVDEVQDLSCVGVRLLHALVGDSRDGLLLVGDGQQAVYPGGFTLAEAGISVAGRARVLDQNYRNGSEILRAALAVVASDEYDDLDTDPVTGSRQIDIERDGGTVVRSVTPDPAAQAQALVEQIRRDNGEHGVRLGDMAVLCPTRAEAGHWHRVLTLAGIDVILLESYDGRTIDAVKIGTYQRAKGLEFAEVFVPDHARVPAARRTVEGDDAYAERASLERRQLFVAMTRARDLLWLG